MKDYDMNKKEAMLYWFYVFLGVFLVLISFASNARIVGDGQFVMSDITNLFVFMVGILFMRDARQIGNESHIRNAHERLDEKCEKLKMLEHQMNTLIDKVDCQCDKLKAIDDDLYRAEEQIKTLVPIEIPKENEESKEELLIDSPAVEPVVVKKTKKKRVK